MMNLIGIIDALASTSSRTGKLDILRSQVGNDLLKTLFHITLSPRINFYIKQIPEFTAVGVCGDVRFIEIIRDLRDKLGGRLVSGHDARDLLADTLTNMSADYAALLVKVIRRDLRCGVSVETVNAVWPDLVPSYPVMLAQPSKEKHRKKIKLPAIMQKKEDGARFNAVVAGGAVNFFSRVGSPLSLLDESSVGDVFIAMAGGEDVVYDGEMVAYQNGSPLPRKTSNGIVNKVIKGTASKDEIGMIHFILWDKISYSGFCAGIDATPCDTRLFNLSSDIATLCADPINILTGAHRIHLIESEYVESIEQATKKLDINLSLGIEGVMLKNIDSPWEDKRSPNIVKMKAERECDLRCVGFNFGTVGTANEYRLGSLQFSSEDGIVNVNVSGFSDDDRNTLTAENTSGRIALIRYNERIVDKHGAHSLFLPVFGGFRDDKNVADTSDLIV